MGEARNIGGVATVKSALAPNDQGVNAGFTLLGTGIDRKDFRSALFMVDAGAATGGPATNTIDAKLQDSADNSSFADVATTPNNPAVAIAQITAVNTRKFLEIDLEPYRRYVRLVFTTNLTGGASPKIGVSASAVLGGVVVGQAVHA